jgi:hypothetical protein
MAAGNVVTSVLLFWRLQRVLPTAGTAWQGAPA